MKYTISFSICKYAKTVLLLCLMTSIYGCAARQHFDERPMQATSEKQASDQDIIAPWQGQQVGAGSILQMSTDSGTSHSARELENVLYMTIRSSVQAHVHCYYRSPNKVVHRIFPDQQSSDTLFPAGKSMILSVKSGIRTLSEKEASPESFLCLASAEKLDGRLPPFIADTGNVGLPEVDFDTLYKIYKRATNRNLIGRTFVHKTTWNEN